MIEVIGAFALTGAALAGGFTTLAVIDNPNKGKGPPSPPPRKKDHESSPETGRSRGLVEKQRARLHELHTHRAAPQPAALTLDPEDAFDSWFIDSFFIPNQPEAADIAPWAAWTASYTTYCNARGWPLLTDAKMIDAIKSYANSHQCEFDMNTGDFIGGTLS